MALSSLSVDCCHSVVQHPLYSSSGSLRLALLNIALCYSLLADITSGDVLLSASHYAISSGLVSFSASDVLLCASHYDISSVSFSASRQPAIAGSQPLHLSLRRWSVLSIYLLALRCTLSLHPVESTIDEGGGGGGTPPRRLE